MNFFKVFPFMLLTQVSFGDCRAIDAIHQLRPGAQWTLDNDDPSTLVWKSTQTIPTLSEVQNEILNCRNNQALVNQQIQADIVNVRTSTNTVQVRIQSLIDLLQLRGQL